MLALNRGQDDAEDLTPSEDFKKPQGQLPKSDVRRYHELSTRVTRVASTSATVCGCGCGQT